MTGTSTRRPITFTELCGRARAFFLHLFYRIEYARRLSFCFLLFPFMAIYSVMWPLSLIGFDLIFAWSAGILMLAVGGYGLGQSLANERLMGWRYMFSGLFFVQIAGLQTPDVYNCFPGVTLVMPGLFY